MDHITIPIPDGMDAAQKAELTNWLRKEVASALDRRMPLEDDVSWQAETARGIKRAMQDVETGRVSDSAEAMKRLDRRIGFNRPG